jgi:HTH-type transcriptional regulator/antitoxin MqsA
VLTGKEVRALRQKLGLIQADAASLFGGGPVAFSKYEADDVTQSDAMDKLLRVVSFVPAVFAYLTEQ